MDDNKDKPDMQSRMEPELEARIVAWVSGEASAFEIAELERLAREEPEVAIFKRRIEAVRDLVAEAVAPEKEPLRISGEARNKLLQAIGAAPGAADGPAAQAPEAPSLAVFIRRQRALRRWTLAAAACLVGALLFTMAIPSFQRMGTSTRPVTLGLEEDALAKKEAKAAGAEKAEETRLRALAIHSGLGAVAGETGRGGRPATAPQAKPTGGQRLLSKVYDKELNARMAKVDAFAASSSLAAKGAGQQVLQSSNFGAGGQSQDSANAFVETQAPRDAENASERDKEEVVKMEPFVVSASEEGNSYRANSTLAGTRVRTDLNDVSTSISVVTDQFLKDLDAKTQNAAPSDNASGPDSAPALADAAHAEAATVVPGAGPDRAPTHGALFDSATIASGLIASATPSPGPNPIVFGIGSPASPVPAATDEVSAMKEPVSTFSLHVGDVSFRLAQDALARGEAPDPARIRPEEFYNAFDYGDPAPALSEKVSCRIEQAADPVKQQRNLVRIAMRVPSAGHEAGQPLRLTVLLDTSGSMEREDRAAAVRRAMEVLVSLLGPNDRVTLIGFARQPRLLAESLPGNQAKRLLDLIARIPAEGGTNLEEALRLGAELARRQFLAGAQNRIVVLTDGAANLGDANPAQLAASVATLRQQGLSFDACGVGIDGINDEVLEALTRKGDGRYYVVDTPESADAGFARQLAGAFRPAAENVKVQVRFNPARVGSYRLIGFEQHRLKEQDFRNDTVEAASLAAGEAAVALYEVEPLPQGDGELGEVYVRFRDTATGAMIERSWTLPYDPYAPAFDRATPTMQLAGLSALVAEKLRGGPAAEAIRLSPLAPVVNALRGHYASEARVQALVSMFEQLRRLEKD
jgi:Ca-activated chloride channel homolog